MKSFPRVFAVYNKATENFFILKTEIDGDKIVRLKQWRRPDYSDWKTADDDRKIDLMPWLTGQEWYIVPQTEREHAKGQIEIHDQVYSYTELPYDLIWSNYIIHRGRHSYTRNEWDTSPGIPVVELNSRRILPRELTEIYVRWSEIHPKEFVSTLDEEGSKMVFPPLPHSEGEDEPRERSWSETSDEIEVGPYDMCCNDDAVKGFAIVIISFFFSLFAVCLPMVVIAAQ